MPAIGALCFKMTSLLSFDGVWDCAGDLSDIVRGYAGRCGTVRVSVGQCSTVRVGEALCGSVQHCASRCDTVWVGAALCGSKQHYAGRCSTMRVGADLPCQVNVWTYRTAAPGDNICLTLIIELK